MQDIYAHHDKRDTRKTPQENMLTKEQESKQDYEHRSRAASQRVDQRKLAALVGAAQQNKVESLKRARQPNIHPTHESDRRKNEPKRHKQNHQRSHHRQPKKHLLVQT